MDKKKLLSSLAFTAVFFCNLSFAQEGTLTDEELAELRKNPDTSSTVYLTEADRIGEINTSTEKPAISSKLGDQNKTYEDPQNPGTFITEARTPTVKSKNSSASDGITFGEMKGEPMSKLAIKQSYKAALYSGTNLDQHALRIAANCEASNTEGVRGAAVINLDDSFYVIPTSTGSLPPRPAATVVNQTVMGIDTNKNCVRDDIEYFIFESYGSKNQSQLRQHLYAHAIWLRFYLIEGISDRSIQAVARQILKTGLCLNNIMGLRNGKKAQTEIFALMHNTDARTLRYFDNEELLTGFDVDISAPPGC